MLLQKLESMYSEQLRFVSKLVIERQIADSLSVDNKEESQIITVEQNNDDTNNCPPETPFLLFNHQNFLLNHT